MRLGLGYVRLCVEIVYVWALVRIDQRDKEDNEIEQTLAIAVLPAPLFPQWTTLVLKL